MAKSLADQLLGAGLVDKQKAQKLQKEKRQQSRKQHKGQAPADDAKARLAQQQAEKVERDRQLNRERQAAEEARAARAQASQMLKQHRQPVGGDVGFNFTDPHINKIKRLFVSAREQEQLAKGMLAICTDEDAYVVVPRATAEKVAERFPDALVFLAKPEDQAPDEDDPYKDFPIPDDLMW